MKQFSLKHTARRGQAMVEMIFSIILFVMLLAGLIAFSLYLYVTNSLMTAAREGARYAATDSRLANVATQSAAISDIRQRVKDVASSATAIALEDADITVTGPSGTFGSRTVTIAISYDYTNAIAPMAFMASYGGGSVGDDSLDASTINVSTVMRYEE
jgi:Flp pilus assembly protein TadG